MKIDLNTILIIAGFAILILFSQSDNSNNVNQSIELLNNKVDSLNTLLIDFNTDSLQNNIKELKHEIDIFVIDSIDYIKDRDSLRAKYNPR